MDILEVSIKMNVFGTRGKGYARRPMWSKDWKLLYQVDYFYLKDSDKAYIFTADDLFAGDWEFYPWDTV